MFHACAFQMPESHFCIVCPLRLSLVSLPTTKNWMSMRVVSSGGFEMAVVMTLYKLGMIGSSFSQGN